MEPTAESLTFLERYVYRALENVVAERRSERANNDPEYSKRVDTELNKGKVNFVLLGRGSEQILIDSIQIMTLDMQLNELKAISIQRDTEAPEVSRFKNVERPYRINQAMRFGGIPLMEEIIENATSLSADFMIIVDMEVLTRAIKEVFDDRLEVCIPWEISDLKMGYFPAGLRTLSSEEVLKVSRARYYANNSHRNAIQQYVLRAIFSRIKDEVSESPTSAVKTVTKLLLFFQKETSNGAIETNFDTKVFFEIGGGVISELAKDPRSLERFGFPEFRERYEIGAENVGDPYDIYRKKPIGGDPDAADLPSGYWQSARTEASEFLTGNLHGKEFSESEICGQNE